MLVVLFTARATAKHPKTSHDTERRFVSWYKMLLLSRPRLTSLEGDRPRSVAPTFHQAVCETTYPTYPIENSPRPHTPRSSLEKNSAKTQVK